MLEVHQPRVSSLWKICQCKLLFFVSLNNDQQHIYDSYLNNVILERPQYNAIYGSTYIQDFRMDNVQIIAPYYYGVYFADIDRFTMRNCTFNVEPSVGYYKLTLNQLRIAATISDSNFIGTTIASQLYGIQTSNYDQATVSITNSNFVNVTGININYGNLTVDRCNFNSAYYSAIQHYYPGGSTQNSFVLTNNYFTKQNLISRDLWTVYISKK